MAPEGALGSPIPTRGWGAAQCRWSVHSNGGSHTLPEGVSGHVRLFTWGSHAGLSHSDSGPEHKTQVTLTALRTGCQAAAKGQCVHRSWDTSLRADSGCGKSGLVLEEDSWAA